MPVVFFFSLGYCLISFAILPYIPQNHISKYTDKGRLWIQGRVVSFPVISGNMDKLILSVEAIGIKKTAYGKRYNGNDSHLIKSYKTKNIKLHKIDLYETPINFFSRFKGKHVKGKIKLTIHDNFSKTQFKIEPERKSKIRYGDKLVFIAKIKSIHNFNNPGGFDYLRYMTFKSVFGSAWADRDKIEILPRGIKFGFFLSFLRSVEDYRDKFSFFIFKKIGDKNTASVLSDLITGKKEYIGKNLRKEFSKAGASHILAISGLHLSIVAGLFFYFFNFLTSFSRPLLIRAWSRKCAAFLTLFPLIFYAILTGFSPSTKRALIMIFVFMFAFVTEKEADSLNSLALAGIVILIVDPGALFSISFQLSFAAVLFIILGSFLIRKSDFAKINNLSNNSHHTDSDSVSNLPASEALGPIRKFFYGLRESKVLTNDGSKTQKPTPIDKGIFQKFFIKVFLFVLTSLCAIAGTQILVMHYFNIISFVGVITNLLLIPAAGFIAVPLGLFALFIHPFFINISGFLVRCAGAILYPCLLFIHRAAESSFTWARTITPDYIEIFCYYLFFAGIFLLFNKRKKAGFICMVSAMIIFSGNEAIWIKRRFFNEDLHVTILDVGQGSSALIELPQGKRVLVDGGGFSYFSNFDTGEYIVAPFLWQKKIMTLNLIVLSHPEADHMNGLVYIFKNFKVKKFIKNCDKRKTNAYCDLLKAVATNGSRVEIISNRERKIKMGGAVIDFFNPFIKCSHTDEPHTDLNNNSLVFRLIFKKISILFSGDIMKDAEKNIASADNKNFQSNVLISPHHGSSTSSSDFFLDKIAPQSVIISCGLHNRFHFPHLPVIKRYRKRGIKIFRTDLTGAVEIFSNGKGLQFITGKRPL